MRIGSTFLVPQSASVVRVAFDWVVRVGLHDYYFMSYRDQTTQDKFKWLLYDNVNKAV